MPKFTRFWVEELHARITPVAGFLDDSFGTNGVVLQNPNGFSSSRAAELAVQSDGKIIVLGVVNDTLGDHPAFFRYNANGSPDTSFSDDGIAIVDIPDRRGHLNSVALQSDGKIVACGTADPTIDLAAEVLVIRLNANGTPDNSFSSDGLEFGNFSSVGGDQGFSIALQSDGKIVVAGCTSVASEISLGDTLKMMAARYNTDGTLDMTFGSDGIAKIDYGVDTWESIADSVLIQSDGDIVLTGLSRPIYDLKCEVTLARLNSEGKPEATFGSNGRVLTNLEGLGIDLRPIFEAVLQPDGKILLAGTSNEQPALLRYNADGSPDMTFGTNGLVTETLSQYGGGFSSIAMQPDGKFVVCGYYLTSQSGGRQSIAARYMANGTLDTSFGPSDSILIPGVVKAVFPNDNNLELGYSAMAVQSDGNIVAAGGASSGWPDLQLAIARYVGSDKFPDAVKDAYSVDQDHILTVDAPGVLGNDNFPTGFATTVIVKEQPKYGTLQFHQDGSFVYTPYASFHGTDNFRYQLNNGIVGNVANVTLTVNPPSTAPVSTNDFYSVDEDQILTVDPSGILGNDQFPAGFTMTISIIDVPTHGSVEIQQDGSFVYTPDTNYNGTDSFTYQLDNGNTGNIASVSLTINSVNDAPVTVSDEYVIPANGNLFVPANFGVLNNDTDVEGDPLKAVLVTPPVDGTLTLNDDGSFTYVPPAGFAGDTTFQYLANDGTDDGDIVTVRLSRNASTQVSGTKLIIAGSDGADSVRLIPSGTTAIYVELISRSGVIRQTLRPAARNQKFTVIEVNLAGGNDNFDAASVTIPIKVIGGAGRDYIRTGSATDTIYGDSTTGIGDGKDMIFSGAGNDRILVGDGDTLIDAGAGNDTVTAGNGDNHIDTGIGNDSVTAGNGDNRIDAGVGNDTVSIGIGFNAVYGGAGNDTVSGGSGQSFVDGGDGNDYITFVGGQNTILGGAGSDVLFGGSGVDVIDGESGNDLIAGGLGADLLSGGDGNDILIDGTVTLKNPTTDTFAKILASFNPARAASLSKINDQLIYTKDIASVDTVYGNAGVDWFWLEFTHDINDLGANEPLHG